MAEIGSAAAAITLTVLKLRALLSNEVNFLLDVKVGIERLEMELKWMKSFLKDAENKLELDNNNVIREWVSNVRDLAYEAEDIIDTYMLKFKPDKQTRSGYWISFPKNIRTTHKLGIQLESLMVKANDILKLRERYNLKELVESHKPNLKLKELRASTHYANKEHMVGLAETVHLLWKKLTNGGSGRFMVSILGMGGLGKTTLARKLYNELRQGHFLYHAWICVSQEYNTNDILLQLIKSMMCPTKMVLEALTTKESLEEYLRSNLFGKSFLVVIDDLWEREAWESLERAFPDNNKSSRVIVTTRIRHVAELNSAYVHELRLLNEVESWTLFCRKAFPYEDGMRCPPILEQLGKEMVDKCKGLPLALVTLGGLLSTKSQGISEWEAVRDNLWNNLKNNTPHIDAVLTLSFKDLPNCLKLCFLYVSMFPEDFKIHVSTLMLLWEAEGFIESEEEFCVQHIAKSYFNELVGRSLLQKTTGDWIGSFCSVHDLLRDLAIKKSKDVCFSAFCDENQFGLLKAPSHIRLAIYNMPPRTIPCGYSNRSLRTFLLGTSRNKAVPSRSSSYIHEYELLRSIHGRFSLLRVLDIKVVEGEVISNLQLDKLIHLRYLGIFCMSKIELPETIGSLKCLQTISIEGCDVNLKGFAMKLQSLKYLIGSFNLIGCGWISKLTCLEKLGYISSENWCEIDATNLVNLRHLYLTNKLRSEDYARFYSNLESVSSLQTLVLDNVFTFHSSQCDLEIFKHRPSITHFMSKGFFNKTTLNFGINLQILEIESSELDYDPMPSIESLPRLRALLISITNFSKPGLVMVCSEGGCPQLQTLDMNLSNNLEVSVAEGGMPLLSNLHVNTPQIIRAPNRIMQLISETLSITETF